MNEEISIKSAKIIKGKTLEVSYTDKVEGTEFAYDLSSKAEVHSDLKNAFNAMSWHLALMTDQISEKEILDKERTEKFKATSYSIGGSEEAPGITLTGQRTLKNGKVITFNSPFTLFEESEESAYRFMKDLRDKIGVIETEILAFINDGKKAPEAQTEMDFGDPVTNVQIDHPQELYQDGAPAEVSKKLNGKKKVAQSAQVPSGQE